MGARSLLASPARRPSASAVEGQRFFVRLRYMQEYAKKKPALDHVQAQIDRAQASGDAEKLDAAKTQYAAILGQLELQGDFGALDSVIGLERALSDEVLDQLPYPPKDFARKQTLENCLGRLERLSNWATAAGANETRFAGQIAGMKKAVEDGDYAAAREFALAGRTWVLVGQHQQDAPQAVAHSDLVEPAVVPAADPALTLATEAIVVAVEGADAPGVSAKFATGWKGDIRGERGFDAKMSPRGNIAFQARLEDDRVGIWVRIDGETHLLLLSGRQEPTGMIELHSIDDDGRVIYSASGKSALWQGELGEDGKPRLEILAIRPPQLIEDAPPRSLHHLNSQVEVAYADEEGLALIATPMGGKSTLWAGPADELRPVAEVGDPAPELGGELQIQSFEPKLIAGHGPWLVFAGRLVGPGLSVSTPRSAFWRFGPEGARLVCLYDVLDGRTFPEGTFSAIRATAVGPDGRVAVHALRGQEEGIWLGRPGELKLLEGSSKTGCHSLRFLRDGRLVVSDGHAPLFYEQDGSLQKLNKLENASEHLIAPDGTTAVLCRSLQGRPLPAALAVGPIEAQAQVDGDGAESRAVGASARKTLAGWMRLSAVGDDGKALYTTQFDMIFGQTNRAEALILVQRAADD